MAPSQEAASDRAQGRGKNGGQLDDLKDAAGEKYELSKLMKVFFTGSVISEAPKLLKATDRA